MALVHVALQEGFEGDAVVVRVDGRDVFQKDGVKTRPQIGYADSVEVNVQEGPARVEVLMPRKNLAETIVLRAEAQVYLGVSISEGRIQFTVSQEPFGYV